MRGLLLVIFLLSIQVRAEKSKCVKSILEEKTPAMQGLISLSCPHLKLRSEAEKFAEFFRRVQDHSWKDYAWSLNPAEFKSVIVATEKMFASKKFKSLDVSDGIVGDFARKKIPDQKRFLSFLIRVFPCADGSDAEHLSLPLTSEFNLNASNMIQMAIAEEKKMATVARKDLFSGCDPSLLSKDSNPYPILKHFTSALMQTWQDLGVPQNMAPNIKNAKAALRGPEAVYIFSLLNKTY